MSENPDLHTPSDRKRAAARANGAKGKGRKTPAGRARSAMNAVTHGVFVRNTLILEGESQDDFDILFDGFVGAFHPADETEMEMVGELIMCRWRQRRLQEAETAVIQVQVMRQQKQLAQEFEYLADDLRNALAIKAEMDFIEKTSRYETRLSNEYRRTHRLLLEHQRRRPPQAPPAQPERQNVQNEANPEPTQTPEVPAPPAQPVAAKGLKLFRTYRPNFGPRAIFRAPDAAPKPAASEIQLKEEAKAAS